jgi:hypothetical protein
MARGKKVDDKTREQIKAFYASCGNMNRTAKEFKVSWSTVKSICEEDDNLEKIREHKKEEWISEAWKTINLYIQHVQTEEVVKRTGARDSAILIGTLHDKMIKNKELSLKREELDLRKKELEHKLDKDKDDDKPIEVVIKRKGDR